MPDELSRIAEMRAMQTEVAKHLGAAQSAIDKLAALLGTDKQRIVTTPHDDPIVQACVDHGGHFWPADAPEDEPATCTRCWFNPRWKAGKPVNEFDLRPVVDRPQA